MEDSGKEGEIMEEEIEGVIETEIEGVIDTAEDVVEVGNVKEIEGEMEVEVAAETEVKEEKETAEKEAVVPKKIEKEEEKKDVTADLLLKAQAQQNANVNHVKQVHLAGNLYFIYPDSFFFYYLFSV